MSPIRREVGGFEELVLLAIQRLQPAAYGVPIREALCQATTRNVSIGAVYTTLGRLEAKGYVAAVERDPLPIQGGRRKRYYTLEVPGQEALVQAEQARMALCAYTPHEQGEKG